MRFEDLTAKANIGYHDNLNPAAWDGDQLKREVRLKLLMIAKVFIKYLDIPNFKVEDVVLTGSMANFNWTKYSDFDLHVVTDYDTLECDDLAEAFYNAKKKLWNIEHDITINEHEVEMYVEDNDQPAISQGSFSILKNEWINKPEYNPPKIDDSAVTSKAMSIAQIIDKVISKNDEDALSKVIEKIYKMRQSGLDDEGEFSTENLAFKVLRNQGYLDKLHKARTAIQDHRLSIK